MANTDDNDDYEVGYGKPPKKSQFKPGQSGNRNGRPKGARGLKTVIMEDAATRISVLEAGKKRKKPKLDLLVQSTFNRAMKGDARAAAQYFDLLKRYLPDEEAETTDEGLSPEEEIILQSLKMRLSRTNPSGADEEVENGEDL